MCEGMSVDCDCVWGLCAVIFLRGYGGGEETILDSVCIVCTIMPWGWEKGEECLTPGLVQCLKPAMRKQQASSPRDV